MAEENAQNLDEKLVECVRELSLHAESGNTEELDRLLDQVANRRENILFQELGKLTRQFHDALNNFRLDARLASFSEKEFPDARDRLRHVVEMTASAADRSLTAAEQSLPLCETIEQQALDLNTEWQRFIRRELSAEEFRQLSGRIGEFLQQSGGNAVQLRNNLNEVMMAQDFQDLTGQIINRVIGLVDDMEENLVELIRLSGKSMRQQDEGKQDEDPLKGRGPVVPGVDDAAENVVSGQDEVDDLLSSLGF